MFIFPLCCQILMATSCKQYLDIYKIHYMSPLKTYISAGVLQAETLHCLKCDACWAPTCRTFPFPPSWPPVPPGNRRSPSCQQPYEKEQLWQDHMLPWPPSAFHILFTSVKINTRGHKAEPWGTTHQSPDYNWQGHTGQGKRRWNTLEDEKKHCKDW